ncbi:MAG: CRISPR-associated endonuclease Cas1 [Gammaproteobacteria bacterium]|nr:CRISPR-associated endonuclease Cas1 [Gammaproteobacteria bacterium]
MSASPLPNFTALLPLRVLVVTLRFTDKARFAFFHQPALTAFVRHLLDSPDDYDTLLSTDTAENGRLEYREGDKLCFSVTALAGGEPLLQRLIRKLEQLPASAPKISGPVPLTNNVALESLTDLFSGRTVNEVTDLQSYSEQSLAGETSIWSYAEMPLRLRWLSPVRLLRRKEERPAKGELRYCREPQDIDGELFFNRLHDCVADLTRRRGITSNPRTAPAAVSIPNADLFWADAHYSDETGRSKEIGGMLGQLELHWDTPPPMTTLQLLVLGQYIGIGQRRTFGWGRYRIESRDGDCTLNRVHPACSLLDHVVRDDNLLAAWLKIDSNRKKTNDNHQDDSTDKDHIGDETDLDTPVKDIPENTIDELAQTLKTGNLAAAPLRGVVLRRPSGDFRALAIPPFWDRVAQRAVTQVLAPALDSIMSFSSFGFRANRSRQKAAAYIQTLYRNGYRWAFESDIEDFFDSVSFEHLALRLESLLDEDPIIGQIMTWMQAPVQYENQHLERDRGLPQGAPLSPLMANLLLDDFDNDLDAHGFRLVRFADDFIILAKSREQAQQASDLIRRSLADWGLNLNESKTRIVSFEQGFKYLGYLFVNDLVLDVGGSKAEAPQKPPSEQKKYSGWLGRVAERTPLALDSNGKIKKDPTKPATAAIQPTDELNPASTPDILHIGDWDHNGLLLTITGDPCLISTHNGRINIQRDELTLIDKPLSTIQALLLIGRHHITTPALRATMQHSVPVHFATAQGRYEGTSWNGVPGAEGARFWLLQQQALANPALALHAAKQIVTTRLRHQREVLRQSSKVEQIAANIQQIDRTRAKIDDCEQLNQLNGFEGAAARAYFGAIAQLLPDSYDFNGRNRQPPRDPFNALLSLGYTALYAHTESVLRIDGLYPWVGFYHQPHGNHATLASDLMEPFRHLVERTALSITLRGRIKPEDFIIGEKGCFLTHKARRLWFAVLEERFGTAIKAIGDTEARPLHDQLHRQNLALKSWIRGDIPTFNCFRIR